MVKVILHTRLGTFLVALIAGLSLALTIGAFAAVRSSDNSSKAMTKATASNGNKAIATKLPDTAVMRVFAKAAADADQLPGPAAAVVESFNNAPGVPEDTLPGKPQLDQARLVLSNVGPSGTASLYAVPTSKHLVCAVWYPDMAGGGCFRALHQDRPFSSAKACRTALRTSGVFSGMTLGACRSLRRTPRTRQFWAATPSTFRPTVQLAS